MIIPWRASHHAMKFGGKITDAVKARLHGNLGDGVKLGLQQTAGNFNFAFFDVFQGGCVVAFAKFTAEIDLTATVKSRQIGNAQLGVADVIVQKLFAGDHFLVWCLRIL